MNYAHFEDKLREIYAAHGKNYPPPPLAAAIWKNVSELPDAFMGFAAEKIMDFEKLPTNLGRELRRSLWPDYLEKNPHLRTRHTPHGCDNCRAGRAGPGWIYAWEADGHALLLKCVCNPGRQGERGWTKRELLSEGFLLAEPGVANGEAGYA